MHSSLVLHESSKKYFKVIMEYFGVQLSPTNSLECRYPLTTILNYNFSRLSSNLTLLYKHPWMKSLAHLSMTPEPNKYYC